MADRRRRPGEGGAGVLVPTRLRDPPPTSAPPPQRSAVTSPMLPRRRSARSPRPGELRVAFPKHCFREAHCSFEDFSPPEGPPRRRYDAVPWRRLKRNDRRRGASPSPARRGRRRWCGRGRSRRPSWCSCSLERIERLDPQLNAFRRVFAEQALLEAEQAEARLKAGEERPLLGRADRDQGRGRRRRRGDHPRHRRLHRAGRGRLARWCGACARRARSSSA